MRLRALIVAALFATGGLVVAEPVQAQSGADLVEACKSNGGSPSMCTGLRQLLRVPGGICRDATDDAEDCHLIDGITIDEALVALHEASWLAKTLDRQRGLDDPHALQDELWPHTHNAFNADAYPFQALGGLDRNQIYTVGDQLRMGIRAVELDIHWAPHITTGDDKAVQVCHGEAADFEATVVHIGCELNSPLLVEHLQEIKTWMDANASEVVMVYLENSLDGDATAHNEAAAQIQATFGDLVYKPASNCADIPMDVTRQQIVDAGKRILITGNCGPGNWGAWVHERGDRWEEGGLDYGDDYPAYPCTERRTEDNYAFNWIRHWGDETGLSAGAQAGGDVTPTDALNMTRCGVNMIGFDNLVPFDERLEQLAWSWAPNEPSRSQNGYCAAHGADGRYRSESCKVTRKVTKIKRRNRPPIRRVTFRFTALPFACFDGTDWHVTTKKDRWGRGEATCVAEGLGHFAVPWNGYENERLKEAKPAAVPRVWLDYRALGGTWRS